jgi:transposase
MWTPTSRRQHSRAGLRYGSDLTEAGWAILEPLLPAEADCGRKRAWPMREIVNAICCVLRAGIAWRLLPDGFPPRRSIYRWFAGLRDDGAWETINHHLVMRDRKRTRREASRPLPRSTARASRRPRGAAFRAMTAGRGSRAGSATRWSIPMARRSSRTRTRQASRAVTSSGRCCGLHVRADRSCNSPLRTRATRDPGVTAASTIRAEIAREPEGRVGFAVNARRRVVERFFTPINRNRRLARDFEATIASAEAFLYAASAILLLRRLARWETDSRQNMRGLRPITMRIAASAFGRLTDRPIVRYASFVWRRTAGAAPRVRSEAMRGITIP